MLGRVADGHFEVSREMFNLELQLITNDHARAQAHYMIGSAWFREAEDGAAGTEKLRAAEKSFREAVR